MYLFSKKVTNLVSDETETGQTVGELQGHEKFGITAY